MPKKINFTKKQKEEIEHLYKNELLSRKDISEIFNCGETTILKILKEKGIDTSNTQRRSLLIKEGRIKIWNKGLTKKDARVFKNTSGNSKLTQFKKGNISHNKGKTKETDEILRKSIEKQIETKKRLFSEGKLKVWNKDKPFLKLEKNPMWKGGISFEPYTKEFNKQFKELIRQRDNLSCLKCNLFQDDSLKLYKRKLICHHIDYMKENTIPENCCALCLRCNTEVNSNRKQWTKFFQSLLSERYGYQYSEQGEPIINLQIDKP